MASENVRLVSAMFEAFSCRDADAMLRTMAPDVEFHAVTGAVVDRPGPYRGHEGVRAYLADAARVWSELRVEPRDFREDGDVVVVLGRVYAWGAGRVIDAPSGWIFRVRDGLLAYGRVFDSQRAALEAAGMADAADQTL